MNKMLKSIKFGKNAFLKIRNSRTSRRLFLTEAYQCQDDWNRRLESPILQKLKSSDFYLELESKYNNVGKFSPLDVDIFANIVSEKSEGNELMDVLYKLRLSAEACNIFDSTHYAVIRFFLKHNNVDDLFEVLNDRLNYGIFPDHYCYNILMDKFIKDKDFASAAKVAGLLMLQEDSDHPLCNALSVYSCHKYLENPSDWKIPEVKEDDTTEEIKIRVPYIRNPYFDDHFDLVDPLKIVGKTLVFQGKQMNNSLGRTCQLRGMILHQKYTQAKELVNKWLNKIKEDIVHEEVFDLIQKDNANIPEDQITEELKDLQIVLDTLKNNNLHKENLIERIENEIKSAVDQCTATDISEQKKIFLEWEKIREETLKNQQMLMDKQLRLANIQKIKEELRKKERLLTFFENEEQIELEIEKKQQVVKEEDEKLAKRPKTLKKLSKLVEEASYVPPTI
ncbi:PREDICTED: 28S ribosomal protein S27, mitochondrial-like [Polistes dominula]|uniref:28S ribosomal protein S27, mitochondrial-like n=1 Tax=Polistes dominula TaxID=743375 RepID=A0ABM1J4X3_POLDO|nr:PREDICTED: 28S ribosomal protein S27, mitochondrial-like [Polistes dominula]